MRKCRVGDRTGSVCFSLWNEQAEAIEAGDILKLTRGLIQLCHNLLSTWGGLIFEPYFLLGLTVRLSNVMVPQVLGHSNIIHCFSSPS